MIPPVSVPGEASAETAGMETAAPASVADPGAEAPTEAKPDPFAHVKAGGEEALAAYKALQSKFDRERAKASRFKALEDLLETGVDASTIRNLVSEYVNVRQNPAMAQAIQRFLETGVPITAQQPQSDPWAEPEPEPDPTKLEVERLRRELTELHGQTSVQKVRGFVDKFFEEHPLPDDVRGEVLSRVMGQMESWSKNDQGVQILKTMNYDTFSALARGRMSTDEIKQVGMELARRDAMSKQRMATGSPSPVGTNGRETPAKLSPLDAFREAFRQFGQDPHKPLLS